VYKKKQTTKETYSIFNKEDKQTNKEISKEERSSG
jgi:hypothetical protein